MSGYTLITPENKKPEKNMLATQANKLVEARYTLSLYEQRLVLMMISMIEPDDEDFKDYIIKVSDFSELIGLKSRNLYPTIKKLLIKLRERTLVIEEGKDYLVTGWISSAKYISNEGVVKLSFDANLKPFLLQLKQEFTKQRLGQAIKFKGVYTIRIYGLLKQYERLGTRSFTVEEFRKVLGITDGKLTVFANLKARTIVQAQKEFSQQDENGAYFSDINFTLETTKTGRKITGLKFNIFSQQTKPKAVIEPPKIGGEVLEQMISIGISQRAATVLFKDFGADYIAKKIELLANEMKVNEVPNPAGYLVTAIKEDWTSKKQEQQKKEAEKREKEKQARLEELTKELRENEIKTLTDTFTIKAKKEFLDSLSEVEKKNLLIEIKEKYSFLGGQINDLNHNMASAYTTTKIPNYEERKQEYLKQNLKI